MKLVHVGFKILLIFVNNLNVLELYFSLVFIKFYTGSPIVY